MGGNARNFFGENSFFMRLVWLRALRARSRRGGACARRDSSAFFTVPCTVKKQGRPVFALAARLSTGQSDFNVRVPSSIPDRAGSRWDPARSGTPEGTRTPNPQNRNLMLYPLSHWRLLPIYYSKLFANVKPYFLRDRVSFSLVSFPALTGGADFLYNVGIPNGTARFRAAPIYKKRPAGLRRHRTSPPSRRCGRIPILMPAAPAWCRPAAEKEVV